MTNRKLKFLVGFLGLVIVGLLLAVIFIPAPDRSGSSSDPDEWVTYRNAEYDFEIRHPADWVVAVNDEDFEPKINIYKKKEKVQPPFIHHHNVTHVSIFPKGVATEGVDGESVPSTVRFTEPTDRKIDFVLSDDSRWATYATLAVPPASWESFGFIWASVRVDSLSSKCLLDGQTLPLNRCDLGDRPPGARIVLSGEMSSADRMIQEQMLETFRKIAPDAAE